MGKFSGLLTTAIFVGLVAILVYYCCRVKRKPGTVVQRSAMEYNGQPIQPVIPSAYPGGLSGHPHIVQHQQNYPPTSAYAQPYPPMQSLEHQHQANHFSGNNMGYPPTSGAAPYPSAASHNAPYPTSPSGGMPMPMPMSNHSAGRADNAFQTSAPYPSASAPRFEPEDLPPPYEAVVNQLK